jgi:hypothetical protein
MTSITAAVGYQGVIGEASPEPKISGRRPEPTFRWLGAKKLRPKAVPAKLGAKNYGRRPEPKLQTKVWHYVHKRNIKQK